MRLVLSVIISVGSLLKGVTMTGEGKIDLRMLLTGYSGRNLQGCLGTIAGSRVQSRYNQPDAITPNPESC